ncbi:MAG: AAA family ATPase [Bacteroidales bacterium]|nr:AAA family ATPase [Bacteroidales bacterium]
MISILKIGDRSENGQVEIVDEDRLCYLVKSISRGAQGLRTISKRLLQEFVDYVSFHPGATPNEARDALSGNSQIDKFEYGYNSTLVVMANMVLDKLKNAPVKPTTVEPYQQIFYGAPGTGKSYKIKEFLESNKVSKENIFRTTFHPDSDYSTFVGAYKPSMEKVSGQQYDKNELINKLLELKKQGGSYPSQRFGTKYWESLKLLTPAEKKEILAACEMKDSLIVEIEKGVAIGEAMQGSRIVYKFISQAFLNAYTQAYRRPNENVYLIIEEINRGNCAQIFGDLFQLLDRDENGFSEYAIKADADLRSFLENQLGASNPGIKDGEISLPANLYIWATMNTSDQSLFPIDSAFKRRWDWKYVKITKGVDDDGSELNWYIDLGGPRYSWWKFLCAINERILRITNSADKQLGFFFCKAKDSIIDAEMFVNKVVFYLWNDVFKDYPDNAVFRDSDNNVQISFDDFCEAVGRDFKPVVSTIKKFLENLGLKDETKTADCGNTPTGE